jgi:hypothetical protein
MERKVKLLHPDLTTYNGCQWVVGEWKETSGEGGLCGPGWLHCYDTPELAVLLNPAHAHIYNPVGYWVEVEGLCKTDHGLKSGYTRMRLIEPLVLPVYTIEQRVRFAIACAVTVYRKPSFVRWATDWLSGQDRSAAAAVAAAQAARGAGTSWANAAARAAMVVSVVMAATAVSRVNTVSDAVMEDEAATAVVAAVAVTVVDIDLPLLARWALTDSLDVPGVSHG